MLLIFAGAPFVEQLRSNQRLSGALAAITAAVVGVILNLTVWFALHVLFAHVSRYARRAAALVRASTWRRSTGGPRRSRWSPPSLMLRLHRGLVETVAVMARWVSWCDSSLMENPWPPT